MKNRLRKMVSLIVLLLCLTACSSNQNPTKQQTLSQALEVKDEEIFYIFKRDGASSFKEAGQESPDTILIKTKQHFETYWLAGTENPPKGFTLNDLSKLSDKAIIKQLQQLDVSSVDQAISDIQSSQTKYASKPAKEFGMGVSLVTNYQKDEQTIHSEDIKILSTSMDQTYTTLSQLDQSKSFNISESTYNGLAKTDTENNVIEGIFIRSKDTMVLEEPSSPDQATKNITVSDKDIPEIANLNKSIEKSTTSSEQTSQSQSQAKEVYQESGPKAPWNAKKSQELADFMVSWGQGMGQYPYKDITNQVASANISFDSQNPADITYSEDGLSDSEYTLVASYEYWYTDMLLHRYLFVILRDGTPQVLYSQNNQGATANDITFAYIIEKETENTDLKNGFANIVNGA